MYVVAFYSHFHTRLAETFSRRCYMPMFWVFLTIYDPGTIMTSQRQYYHRAIFVTIDLASITFALQQLGNITDNVNISLADTDVLFDFEPPTMVRPLQESYTHLSDWSLLLWLTWQHLLWHIIKHFVHCQTTTTTIKHKRTTDTEQGTSWVK